MKKTLKKLIKHSTIYGLGSLLSKLLGFILLPIYTRYLTPTDYGVLSLLLISSEIVCTIEQVGIGSALFREVIYQGSDEGTVESTALYFLIGEAALLCGILFLFSPLLSELIFNNPSYAYLLRLIFTISFLSIFELVFQAKMRIHTQSALFSTLSVSKFLTGAALNIYFIAVLQRGVEGLIVAGLILELLFALIYLVLMLRHLKIVFVWSILKRLLSFGVPLVPAGLSRLILASSDRYFLQFLTTTAEVGLYSLGYRIGLAVSLIVQAIQLAWPAEMFTLAKGPHAEKKLAKLLTYYLVILGFFGLGLSVLTKEVLVIMTTPKFYAAYKVVPLVVISYILYGVRFMTNTALETQNKMKYVPPIIISAAGLNLVLNYLLIPSYGMMGAAWATVISYLFLVTVQTVVNLRFWYIPYEYKRIAKLAITYGLVYAVSLLVATPNLWFNIFLKLTLLATYPFLLYLMQFYEEAELKAVRQFLGSRAARFIRKEETL